MPLRQHVGAQLGVVVDLAVVDDDHRPVGVGHRLRAAGDVEDRQPAVPEAHAVADEEAVAVRPAVHDRVGHRPHERGVAEAGRPCDAAHQCAPFVAKLDSKWSTIQAVTSILSARSRVPTGRARGASWRRARRSSLRA